MPAHPSDIVAFWRNAGPKRWFEKDSAFDDAIRLKFEPTHHAVALGRIRKGGSRRRRARSHWLILLDQFPATSTAAWATQFATDGLARKVAREALARGHDRALEPAMRNFLYLPFTHSEDMADQDLSLALNEGLAREANDPALVKWAVVHRDIVVRFGRFPHRNAALGRDTTPEEQAFLDEGGFAG